VNQNTVTYRIEIYQMRIYQRLKVHFIYLTKSKKRYSHTSLEIRQSLLDINLAHLVSMTVIRQGVPMGGDKS
jgi:hypothetical protein